MEHLTAGSDGSERAQGKGEGEVARGRWAPPAADSHTIRPHATPCGVYPRPDPGDKAQNQPALVSCPSERGPGGTHGGGGRSNGKVEHATHCEGDEGRVRAGAAGAKGRVHTGPFAPPPPPRALLPHPPGVPLAPLPEDPSLPGSVALKPEESNPTQPPGVPFAQTTAPSGVEARGTDFQLMRIPLFCVCESFASHKQKV